MSQVSDGAGASTPELGQLSAQVSGSFLAGPGKQFARFWLAVRFAVAPSPSVGSPQGQGGARGMSGGRPGNLIREAVVLAAIAEMRRLHG